MSRASGVCTASALRLPTRISTSGNATELSRCRWKERPVVSGDQEGG